jgi:hypothetical protein
MIKKLFFIATVFSAAYASAQTFQFLDVNNNDITGTNHYEYGTGASLAATKFHIKNVSGTQATYKAKAYEMTNPTSVDLQICFGTSCYIAPTTNSNPYNAPDSSLVSPNGTDTDFKVGPFSFGWVAGDSATWRVTVYNNMNPNDSASAIITWKVAGVSISELTSEDVSIKAFPNPVSDNLTINYAINGSVNDGRIEMFDVLGQKVSTHKLLKNKGQLNIDVTNLNSGIYFYSLKADGQVFKTERVVVR